MVHLPGHSHLGVAPASGSRVITEETVRLRGVNGRAAFKRQVRLVFHGQSEFGVESSNRLSLLPGFDKWDPLWISCYTSSLERVAARSGDTVYGVLLMIIH